MHITELSIKRPAMMTMVIMMFVVLGIYTYNRIGVELFPAINIPYVTVVTSYPGAGAEEVESQIIKPMEADLSSISKVKNITSIASEGSAITMLEFDLTADADKAQTDVQKRVDALRGSLPDDAATPVVIKRDISDVPVLVLALQSNQPVTETYRIAKDIVKERLQKVPGVSDVTLVGGQEREVHVDVDRNKLAGYGLTLSQIINRLKAENLNQPSGRLDRPEAEYNLRVLGEFSSIDDIRDLEIPAADGSTVRLRDVANVYVGYQEQREYSRVNGVPSIGMVVFKQSDASVVDVADQALQAIKEIQAQLPGDNKIIVSQNVAQYIQLSLDSTRRAIIEGIITTALALFIFLREWRSMVIVLLAIPTSLLATMMMIYFAGFTFNMMSLMGLALCIGILVDDSIVVLENIHRHLKMGKTPAQAALDGRAEIGMAAVAITLSDVVVFAPIAFMGGMVGQFFRQFGLTIVFATLFSLFISFTLTPMAASLLFKQQNPSGDPGPLPKRRSILGFLWKYFGPIGDWFQRGYDRLLHWSLDHRKSVVGLAVFVFFASLLVFPLKLVGGEFMPKSDQNELNISLEMPVGTPIKQTDDVLKIVEKYLGTIREIKYYHTTLGSSGGHMASSSGSNIGQIGVTLVSKADRQRTVWQVGDQIRNWAARFPKGRLQVSENDSMGGGGSAVQIELTGSDSRELIKYAEQIKQVVASIKGATEVETDTSLGQPELQFNINRDRAAALGLSVSDIARTLRSSVNGETAGQFREGDDDLDIVTRIAGASKTDFTNLGGLLVSSGTGAPVQLDQVVDIKQSTGPTQIRRINRERAITISGNLQDRQLNDFTAEAQKKVAALHLPAGYSVKFAGQAQSMQESGADLAAALVLSIVLVYMVLVMLYESFSTPFIRMLSLPLGIVGALLALALAHQSLNLFSMIGIIMLDGLVAKNGTLLLDYTNTLRDRGYSLRDALIEAGKTRLRPIAMTTMTMIFGMLPTALATGEGAESRAGMAWVLIGGLITSTLFTLVIIPVASLIIEGWKQKLAGLIRRKNRPEIQA